MLKHNREFQRVYRKGKSAHAPSLVLFYLPDDFTIRVGFTASKKVGNAVMRNRAKRRMRALFQELEHRLLPGSFVLVAKAETVDIPYESLKRNALKLLGRVGALKP